MEGREGNEQKSSDLLLRSSAKSAKSCNFQMYLQQPCRHLCIKENERNKTKKGYKENVQRYADLMLLQK